MRATLGDKIMLGYILIVIAYIWIAFFAWVIDHDLGETIRVSIAPLLFTFLGVLFIAIMVDAGE